MSSGNHPRHIASMDLCDLPNPIPEDKPSGSSQLRQHTLKNEVMGQGQDHMGRGTSMASSQLGLFLSNHHLTTHRVVRLAEARQG